MDKVSRAAQTEATSQSYLDQVGTTISHEFADVYAVLETR